MSGEGKADTGVPEPSKKAGIEYMAHIQHFADTDFIEQPDLVGTQGQSLRLEGFAIRLLKGSEDVGLRYKAHLQGIGDTKWVYMDEFCGTRGQSRRLEALWIEVTGDAVEKYDVYYIGWLQNQGWTAWMRNGEMCGTRGQSRRLEAFRAFLSEK